MSSKAASFRRSVHLVLGAAVGEVEDRPRQAGAGERAHRGDAE